MSFCGDQEFVNDNRTASTCGVNVTRCILQLNLDWRKEAGVCELITVVMKQLGLLIELLLQHIL
jgi:hypothetical protein